MAYVYDRKLLEEIKEQTFKSKILDDSRFLIRPLTEDDYHRGYLDLLSHLTVVGDVSEMQFKNQFHLMQQSKQYYITVIEDVKESKIVASATLLIEHKFIHECSYRGRLEDIVVDPAYRGNGLACFLINVSKVIARRLNCYKLTLDGRKLVSDLYIKTGFAEDTNQSLFQIRFS